MLVTSGTYAYLEMKKNTSVAGSAKCNGINYQGEEINASNLSSTTNYLEGAKSTITLSQSEDCKIYSYVNIYLHVNDNITAPIDSIKALKYKLITEDKIEYNGTITTKGDSLLAVVPLTSNPKSYQVYLWIDSEISNGQFDNKSFSGYIYATSEQSSTIGGGEISNNENVSIETIDFDYVGREQEFIVPVNDDYKLETWGAQGASDSSEYHGGYGAYAVGTISLTKNMTEYVYVGGKGQNLNNGKDKGIAYGYPNGGAIRSSGDDANNITYSSGGGSTHISIAKQTVNNLLKNEILILSSGGGGTCTWWSYVQDNAGSGGGIVGSSTVRNFANVNPTGGTQTSGGTGGGNLDGNLATKWLNGIFGVGGGTTINGSANVSGGGGGGLYGGGASWGGSGAGGSSYIGNSLLTNKSMYCYNCEESADESTKTISTTNVSEDAIREYAKEGNGYARITLIK